MSYTRDQIDKAVNDPEFHKALEIKVGTPAKVQVSLSANKAFVKGPKGNFEMDLDDFIELSEEFPV